jgi:Family of unknown function (DUF5677)
MARRSKPIPITANPPPVRPFNDLQEAFLKTMGGMAAEKKLTGKQLSKVSARVIKATLPQAGSSLLRRLKRTAPKMLREKRADDEAFSRRNLKRWRKALDLLEMEWVISEETGSAFNATYRPEAAKNNDYVFEALTFLHARSLLVTSEIICLLRGGFADGALSRWRTLHELAVISTFIRTHDCKA